MDGDAEQWCCSRKWLGGVRGKKKQKEREREKDERGGERRIKTRGQTLPSSFSSDSQVRLSFIYLFIFIRFITLNCNGAVCKEGTKRWLKLSLTHTHTVYQAENRQTNSHRLFIQPVFTIDCNIIYWASHAFMPLPIYLWAFANFANTLFLSGIIAVAWCINAQC